MSNLRQVTASVSALASSLGSALNVGSIRSLSEQIAGLHQAHVSRLETLSRDLGIDEPIESEAMAWELSFKEITRFITIGVESKNGGMA